MTTQPRRKGGSGLSRGIGMLARIERAERRLWRLALVLFMLLALSLLLLDATTVATERGIGGITTRFLGIIGDYGTSAALLVVVLLTCAYFSEKLVAVRRQNRELVSAIDSTAKLLSLRNQQLDAWSQLSHNLITNFNLPRLLDLIVRTATDVTECDCGVVMLVEEDRHDLRVAAIQARGLQVELARRVAEIVIRTGEELYLRPGELPEELDRPDLPWEDLVSLVAAPLTYGKDVVGAILVGRVQPREAFGEDVIDSLSSFASQASIALEKAKLYAESQKQLDRLGKLLDGLRSTQVQLIESEKLAGLGLLADKVARGISYPVTAITARSDLLLEREECAPDLVRRDVTAIRHQAARISETLKGLLTLYGRKEGQQREPADVNEIIRETLDVLRDDLEMSGIEVAEHYGELPGIRASASDLQHVFVNLLVSACHAMRQGGRLTITTRTSDSGSVEVCLEQTGGTVLADLGEEGLAAALLRSDGDESKHVLGVAYRSVRALGGEMEATAKPGEKTELRIQLPVSASVGASGQQRRSEQPYSRDAGMTASLTLGTDTRLH